MVSGGVYVKVRIYDSTVSEHDRQQSHREIATFCVHVICPGGTKFKIPCCVFILWIIDEFERKKLVTVAMHWDRLRDLIENPEFTKKKVRLSDGRILSYSECGNIETGIPVLFCFGLMTSSLAVM